ncbi:G-protein coupled receptor 4-like [Alosa sapidissima]|uniref:G-protein coupled receptor 4-like n=1 Tax=Alosa sapidissima TaxID=34773 RepID=UPI001C07F7C3|nr:G-protein coupled receptor 4-like [Alosa sapidissima]
MKLDVFFNASNASMPKNCDKVDLVDRFMYPTAYSVFFIIGFPANCLSFYVAYQLMQKGNTIAVYLVNLSVSDLLYTITLPVWIELSLGWPVDSTLCSLITLIMYNSFYVGTGLLCCISVDRYLAVFYPLHFLWVRELRTATLVSAVVWVAEFLVHASLLAHSGALESFSALRLCEERMPMHPADAIVAIVRATLGFLLPLLLMIFCFCQIMRALNNSASLENDERSKIRNLLLLLLITYMVAFTPYQLVMVLRAGLEPVGNCGYATLLRDYYMVFVATTTINSVADPIIYCLMSQSAKTELKAMLRTGRVTLRKLQTKDTSDASVA